MAAALGWFERHQEAVQRDAEQAREEELSCAHKLWRRPGDSQDPLPQEAVGRQTCSSVLRPFTIDRFRGMGPGFRQDDGLGCGLSSEASSCCASVELPAHSPVPLLSLNYPA